MKAAFFAFNAVLVTVLIPVPSAQAASPKRSCDFIVGFGSRCCGPDSHQIEQLESYLKANPELVSAESRGRGKEGEREYCVHVRNHGDLLAVRGHLSRIVSVKPKRADTPSGSVVNCYEKNAPEGCRDPDWKSKPER